jgi:hypothetical protein
MPPTDNSQHLAEAARHRSADTRRRALAAIALLTADGRQVSPTTVARHAGVSRQWLYTCHEAMDAIEAARAHSDGPTHTRPPQQASTASLRRRVELLTDDNKRLRQRVADLEAQLAILYGALRTRRTTPPVDSVPTVPIQANADASRAPAPS